jgi:hypothetical protein
MFPWNRKEVYVGFSMQDFVHVRDTLAANRIAYDMRTVNHSTKWTGVPDRMGRFGENPAFESQYYVYVNKQDYENAKYLLQK